MHGVLRATRLRLPVLALPAAAVSAVAAASAAGAEDDDDQAKWAGQTRVEDRCDMDQLVRDLRALYGCKSLAQPEILDRLYERRAKFQDPAMTLRSRASIRSAFDGMAVLFGEARVQTVDILPRDGTVQDPDILVAWVAVEYDFEGRKVPFRTAVRLTFTPSKCTVARHEDLWNGKEFPRRETIGFLGNAFDMLRDVNGVVCGGIFRVMASMEMWRRRRAGMPAPHADGDEDGDRS